MKNMNNNIWWRPGLLIFAKISALISIPIIIALIVGKYFDKKYNTDPWIFLILTFIAFLTSIYSIWKNIKVYIKEIENKEKNNL